MSASARFVNGVVETKYDPDTQMLIAFPSPTEPTACRLPGGGHPRQVGDSFRIVFNEQVVGAGGSLVTVNAAHM